MQLKKYPDGLVRTYYCKCCKCKIGFIGDKRDFLCIDCGGIGKYIGELETFSFNQIIEINKGA